jgi:hypothetical protein
MVYNDIIGIVGVAVILIAYFLNTEKLIPQNGKLFYTMNTIGAALACYASFLIGYWPFVVLEGAWTLISIYGLMRVMKINIT